MPKQVRKQLRNKPELSLRVRAMRYLARREHSRVELQHKLQPHVQEGEDLDAVLDELEKRNWLSDARATTQLVHAKRGRFGTQRIAHELRQKGIAENLIAEALPQLEGNRTGCGTRGMAEEVRYAASGRQGKSQTNSFSAIAWIFHRGDSQGDEAFLRNGGG